MLSGFQDGQYDISAGFGIGCGAFGMGTNECAIARRVDAGVQDITIVLPISVTEKQMQAGEPIGCIHMEGTDLQWLRNQRWGGSQRGQTRMALT